MLRFLDPRPSSGLVLERGQSRWSLDQSYTSVFLADSLPNPQLYLADMEIYVADFGWRHGIGASTDFSLHWPLLHPLGGFLDGFLHDYHRALGLPNSDREKRGNNNFAYYLRGEDGVEGSSRWEPGNLRLNVKHALEQALPELDIALEGDVQFPTGSRSRGWSHSGVDAALGAAFTWRKERFSSNLNSWWVHPFTRTDAGTPVRDFLRMSLTLGYEMHWWDSPFDLMIQTQGGGSPYQTGIEQLDSAPWLISFGFRAGAMSRFQWSFAFVENITQDSTQDFGASLGLSFTPR